MKSKFYFRRGQSQSWTEQNIVLGPGEPGFELDTGKLKVGNGTTAWNDLPYINSSSSPIASENPYFEAAAGSLPTGDIKEGTFCLLDGELLYVYADGEWRELKGKDATIDVIKIKGSSSKVGDQEYDNINDAINNAANGSVVKIGSDATAFSIPSGKSLTVNLNGAKIVNDQGNPIQNAYNASLIIEGEGHIECNKHGASVLDNKGTVSIMNGSFSRSIDEKNNGGYVAVNHGEMNIYNGVFSSPGDLSSLIENGYYNYSTQYKVGETAENPHLTINGGTFIDHYTTIKNDDNGTCEINDGNFYGMIYNVGKEMTINGGYFYTDDGYEVIDCKKSNDDINSATLYINGGKFETTAKNIIVASGNPIIIIKGGEFNREIPEEYILSGYTQKLLDNGFYSVVKEE